jgi:hypothetical protein
LPGLAIIGAALVAWNLWWFGAIEGGQRALEGLHPRLHDYAGIFSGDLRQGAAGTLLSPSRGLFVYCPWAAVTLAVLPAVLRRLRARRLACWLAAALVPYFLLLSKYSVWWAGHSFGPRYWTDVIPIFAILLALALDLGAGALHPRALPLRRHHPLGDRGAGDRGLLLPEHMGPPAQDRRSPPRAPVGLVRL